MASPFLCPVPRISTCQMGSRRPRLFDSIGHSSHNKLQHQLWQSPNTRPARDISHCSLPGNSGETLATLPLGCSLHYGAPSRGHVRICWASSPAPLTHSAVLSHRQLLLTRSVVRLPCDSRHLHRALPHGSSLSPSSRCPSSSAVSLDAVTPPELGLWPLSAGGSTCAMLFSAQRTLVHTGVMGDMPT